MTTTPPGWYPDPNQPGTQRYWDGSQWTQQTAPGGGGPAHKKGGNTVLKVVLGVLLAGVLLIVGCSALLIGGANEVSKSIDKELDKTAITQTQFDSIKIGDNKAAVLETLGEPMSTSETGDAEFGIDCVYYNVKDGDLFDVYSLCFDATDKLESKDQS